ncbi:19560_t:CDS:2, partial [Racocetra fulgida]
EFVGSRFFRGGSDSESEEEDIISSDELSDEGDISEEPESEDEVVKPQQSRYLKDATSDDSDSEIDRKERFKSGKDKRMEAIETCIKAIENAQKINDWVVIQNGKDTGDLDSQSDVLSEEDAGGEQFTKNTDRLEQIKTLQKLLEVAATPYQQIRVLIALIPAQFDYNPSMSNYMNVDITQKEINQLLTILETNPQFMIHEFMEEDIDDKEPVIEPGQIFGIRGSIVSFIDRLDDEFTKSLQNIDPHTTDYVDRLKDETDLYDTIIRGQIYFEKNELNEIQQLYPAGLTSKITSPTSSSDPSDLIHALCVYLYKKGESLLRTRAMLCHIYHHALHNRFYVARDMLLMSHLQDNIHQSDVGTQILHNRTMVQVGLCAFREGMIKEAQSCLQEICGTGRAKELLAQGLQLQRYSQLPLEQEKLDRQRQLPFHMHINLELLECAYLTCSMLLEIPSMAAAGSNPEARPPENTRDHIMGAAKALAAGEWKRCQELISAIKIWDLMPETQKIKEMLNRKIQEEGLRTYLFTYSAYYETLGIEQLAIMFSLPTNSVTAIISKMIWNEELVASLDQVDSVVVLHRVEPTKVQQLALMFAEKAASFVEANEKTLELKQQAGQNQRDQQRQKETASKASTLRIINQEELRSLFEQRKGSQYFIPEGYEPILIPRDSQLQPVATLLQNNKGLQQRSLQKQQLKIQQANQNSAAPGVVVVNKTLTQLVSPLNCNLNSTPPDVRFPHLVLARATPTPRGGAVTKTTKPKKPPRPPNAFILYRRSKQQAIVAANEGISNNEVSKQVGEMWHKEPIEEKMKFQRQADAAKLEHMRKYPEYKYRPRRPHEKRRRTKSQSVDQNTSTDTINTVDTGFDYYEDEPRRNSILSAQDINDIDYEEFNYDQMPIYDNVSNMVEESNQIQYSVNSCSPSTSPNEYVRIESSTSFDIMMDGVSPDSESDATSFGFFDYGYQSHPGESFGYLQQFNVNPFDFSAMIPSTSHIDS